jgi:putative ABC transport system substrate-binding protein
MRRREFIGLAASAAAAWPLAGRAQQTSGMLRLGAADFSPRSLPSFAAFERRMAELGYREGKNITFDYVQTAGPEKSAYETGYREVVERKADILLAPGPEICLKSALAASQTTPIVMLAITYDPFERGYVATLAKPGGRITGLFLRQIELTVKRLQFLKDALPEFYSAIVFFDSISVDQWKAAEDVGAKFGVRLSGIDLHNPPFDYDRALAEAPPDNRKNLFVPASPRFFADRERLTKFALRNHLASMFPFRESVDAGGLMSYGPSLNGMFRQAADVVDRIARGAKPGDMPIEQPTKFEFVVNLTTARALGLDLSPILLARADEVIE